MFRISLVCIGFLWSSGLADEVDPKAEGYLFGAKSQAMSGAINVSAQGVDALFHNPAGTACRLKTQISAGFLKLSLDRSASWVGAVIPRGKWCASVSWACSGVADVPLRSNDGTLVGHDSWRSHRLGVGYARALDFLTYVGGDFHYLRTDAPDLSGNGFGADIGLVRFILPPLLSVGCAVNDVGTAIHYEGTGRTEIIRPKFTGGAVLGLVEGKIRIEWNIYKRLSRTKWRNVVGLEIKARKDLILRAGYGEGGLSVGLGISIVPMTLAYSTIQDGFSDDLGQGLEALWTKK